MKISLILDIEGSTPTHCGNDSMNCPFWDGQCPFGRTFMNGHSYKGERSPYCIEAEKETIEIDGTQ